MREACLVQRQGKPKKVGCDPESEDIVYDCRWKQGCIVQHENANS